MRQPVLLRSQINHRLLRERCRSPVLNGLLLTHLETGLRCREGHVLVQELLVLAGAHLRDSRIQLLETGTDIGTQSVLRLLQVLFQLRRQPARLSKLSGDATVPQMSTSEDCHAHGRQQERAQTKYLNQADALEHGFEVV